MPEALLGGTFEAPSMVTGLARDDSAALHELPPFKKYFELGTDPECHIEVHSPHVSKRHLKLERKPLGLLVTDLGSKNGTAFEGQRQRKGFYIRPGKTFVVGAVTHRFLALNDQMRAVYPVLLDILGEPEEHSLPSNTPTPNRLILAAVNGDHLLITGDPNCEQRELARIVHSVSNLHEKEIVEPEKIPVDAAGQRDLFERAVRSTLVLDLGKDDTRLPSGFMSQLAAAKQVRVIVLATELRVAHKAFGPSYAQRLQDIWVRPLASRTDAIDRVLDRMFAKLDSRIRVSMLTTANQVALRRYHWPKNFASLREVAVRLSALHRHQGNFNRAAHDCSIAPSSLYEWYPKMGLVHPLVADE